MRPLWKVADLIRSIRRQLRFGRLSRAPLSLLRVELRGDTLECDWFTRPPDAWDSGLPRTVSEQNESQQALEDAISLRAVVFDEFRNIDGAVLRAFRQPAREPPELVILGTVSREATAGHRVSSLAMRAKLLGFCFCFEDGFLRPLQQVEDHSRT